MNAFQDFLLCPICKENFSETPLILSCCNATVCRTHIEYENTMSNKRKFFDCTLCGSHELDGYKFASNTKIEKHLNMNIEVRVKLGEEYEKGRREIENLESTYEKMSALINDPKNFVYEHVSELKRAIDLRREKFVEMCNKMIDKIGRLSA